MAISFKTQELILTKQSVRASGDNLIYVNGVPVVFGVSGALNQSGLYLVGQIAATGQAALSYSNGIGANLSGNLAQTGAILIARDTSISGALEGRIVSTGNAAVVHADGMGLIISGNLTNTGIALNNRINSLSGYTSNQLTQSGAQTLAYINSVGLTISGNLTQTGATLFNRDASISGGLETRIQATGNAAVAQANSIGQVISGNLTLTGQMLNNRINSLSGFVGNVSGGLENKIFQTGNAAIIHANSIGNTISGNLTITGQTLFNRDAAISGGLEARITATGNAAVAHANGIGANLSGNLTLTGQTLFNRDASISGGLEARIAATGQASWISSNGANQTLSGQLNSLSGWSAPAAANYVYTTGNQAIGGAKTFNGNLQVPSFITGGNVSGWIELTSKGPGIGYLGTPSRITISLVGGEYQSNARTEYLINFRGGVEVKKNDINGSVAFHQLRIYDDTSVSSTALGKYSVGLLLGAGSSYFSTACYAVTTGPSASSGVNYVPFVSKEMPTGLSFVNFNTTIFTHITSGGDFGVGVTPTAKIHSSQFIRAESGYFSGSQNLSNILYPRSNPSGFITGLAGTGSLATQNQLNSLSGWTDSVFVHRTGNELISGDKYFNGNIYVNLITSNTPGGGNIQPFIGSITNAEGRESINWIKNLLYKADSIDDVVTLDWNNRRLSGAWETSSWNNNSGSLVNYFRLSGLSGWANQEFVHKTGNELISGDKTFVIYSGNVSPQFSVINLSGDQAGGIQVGWAPTQPAPSTYIYGPNAAQLEIGPNGALTRDKNGTASVDFNDRKLISSFGDTVLDWQNSRLSGVWEMNSQNNNRNSLINYFRLSGFSGWVAPGNANYVYTTGYQDIYGTKSFWVDEFDFVGFTVTNTGGQGGLNVRWVASDTVETTIGNGGGSGYALIVSKNLSFLADKAGKGSVDFNNRRLVTDGSNESLNWFYRTLSGNWHVSSTSTQSGSVVNYAQLSGLISNLSGNNNSLFVHRTGNELISGDKTFISKINVDTINDVSDISSISVSQKRLLDDGGTQSIEWGTRLAYDENDIQSIDWHLRNALDENGEPAINWGAAKTLYCNDGTTAALWNQRRLVDSSTVFALDWESKILSGNWSTNTWATSSGSIVNYAQLSGFINNLSGSINSLYVHRTGNELISGNKIFVNGLLADSWASPNSDYLIFLNNASLIDADSCAALNWNNKNLAYSDGEGDVVTLNWFNRHLSGNWNVSSTSTQSGSIVNYAQLSGAITNLSGVINFTSGQYVSLSGEQIISGVKTFVDKMGVGTNNPDAFLHVTGTIRSDKAFLSGNTNLADIFSTKTELLSTSGVLSNKIDALSGWAGSSNYDSQTLISNNYSVLPTDQRLYCNNTSTVQLTFPSSTTYSGIIYRVKLINTGSVILTGTNQTFDMSPSYMLNGKFSAVEIHAVGNNSWYIW